MGVKRLFAHAEFPGQVVHGDAAKAMREKVAPRAFDNPLTG
jgi:hypothetical protein